MVEECEEEDLGIKPGMIIDSAREKYVVEKMLGEGGFGAVFKVHIENDKSAEFALKVEKKLERRRHSKLKMEIAILKLVSSLRADRSHFTKIIDRGKKPDYFFLVMQLVGKSLADLKAERHGNVFSFGTGLGAGVQCLEAVEDLHSFGYIHRDLKPANYSVGLESQQHLIYILDFGIARKITKEGGEIKTPRITTGFKGTLDYASLAAHEKKDMGKKDDCESWFYLLIDLIVSGGLPWGEISEKEEIRVCKARCRNDGTPEFDKLYHKIKKGRNELIKIFTYVTGLSYVETPDYGYIYKMVQAAAADANVQIDDPYDWEEIESISIKRRMSKKQSQRQKKDFSRKEASKKEISKKEISKKEISRKNDSSVRRDGSLRPVKSTRQKKGSGQLPSMKY